MLVHAYVRAAKAQEQAAVIAVWLWPLAVWLWPLAAWLWPLAAWLGLGCGVPSGTWTTLIEPALPSPLLWHGHVSRVGGVVVIIETTISRIQNNY